MFGRKLTVEAVLGRYVEARAILTTHGSVPTYFKDHASDYVRINPEATPEAIAKKFTSEYKKMMRDRINHPSLYEDPLKPLDRLLTCYLKQLGKRASVAGELAAASDKLLNVTDPEPITLADAMRRALAMNVTIQSFNTTATGVTLTMGPDDTQTPEEAVRAFKKRYTKLVRDTCDGDASRALRLVDKTLEKIERQRAAAAELKTSVDAAGDEVLAEAFSAEQGRALVALYKAGLDATPEYLAVMRATNFAELKAAQEGASL